MWAALYFRLKQTKERKYSINLIIICCLSLLYVPFINIYAQKELLYFYDHILECLYIIGVCMTERF